MGSYQKWLDFLNELKVFEGNGVYISLDGVRCEPEKVVEVCCIQEESHYMRDYVQNERNEVIGLNFDKVVET